MVGTNYLKYVREYLVIALSLHETPYEALNKAGLIYPDYVYFLTLDESKGIIPTEPAVLPEECEVGYVLDLIPEVEAFGCIVLSEGSLQIPGEVRKGLLAYYRGVGKSFGAFRTYEYGKLSSSIIWILEDTIDSQNEDELEIANEDTDVVESRRAEQ